MSPYAHLGIEYNDLGLRIAVLVDGQLRTIGSPFDDQVLFDSKGSIGPLSVGFPGFFRLLGDPRTSGGDTVLRGFFRVLHKAMVDELHKELGRLVVAVPTGLMSGHRALIVNSAQASGFNDVELVDVSVPSAIVYSSSTDTPTTQLVYYLGYGECEYALLRVVPGRVSVIDSGIARSVSGQLFDAQLIEAIILALREQNIFLGLKGFRSKQWLEFRRIAAKAREDLGKNETVKVAMPQALIGDTGAVRLTLSAAGFAARMAPTIKGTIDDINGLLEQNEIKATDLDAVVALGDTAVRHPVTALLAQAFPGKVKAGDINTIAAAAATYSAWLQRKSTDGGVDRHLSFYLSPYQGPAGLALQQLDGASLPIVTEVTVEGTATAPARASEPDSAPATPTGGNAPVPDAVATAREMIERGRNLIEEAGRLLQRLEPGSPAAGEQAAAATQEDDDTGAAQIFMDQAEELLARGRYAEAVNLAHRAYAEASLDGKIFAAMLRVHVTAALAMHEPDQYEDSIKLLLCAHSHDRTDKSVHRALAARHYMHAQAMHERNDEAAAMEAVNEALRFDPKHQEAQDLLGQIKNAEAGKAE